MILEFRFPSNETCNSSLGGYTPQSFLLSYNTGAYTFMTVRNNEWIQLDFHIHRLAESCRLIESWSNPAIMLPAQSSESIRPLLLPLLDSSLHSFRRSVDDSCDLKLVVLATEDRVTDQLLIAVFCDTLIATDVAQSVSLMLFGIPRINPLAKNSSWLLERRYITDRKPKYCDECILHDADGNLYEGTVSNLVFIVNESEDSNDYSVVSAPLGTVLEGSVLTMLEKVCCDMSIPFKRVAFPNIKHKSSWTGALILNASRIAAPVTKIFDSDEQLIIEFKPSNRLVKKLVDNLAQKFNGRVVAQSNNK